MTIEQALAAAGFGHRRLSHSTNTGQHMIYRLDTGAEVGPMTACDAIEWLDCIRNDRDPETGA